MESLEDLVSFKENMLEMWYDFDPEFEKKEEYDLDALYQAFTFTKLVVSLTNLIEPKIDGLNVPGARKISLDSFFCDAVIYLGPDIHTMKEKLLSSEIPSPFKEFIYFPADPNMKNDYDTIGLTSKIESNWFDPGIGPIDYETINFDEYYFCASHLWFTPKCNMVLDGNIAQTNYIAATKAILQYFIDIEVPFAMTSNNWRLDKHDTFIIGGVNGQRNYRVNPKKSSDLAEVIWLTLMEKMLPEYNP